MSETTEDVIEEVEVTEFRVSPSFLRIMVLATDLLEKVASGELTLQEARAIYESEIIPVITKEKEKATKARSRKRSSSSKSKKSKKSKNSSDKKKKK